MKKNLSHTHLLPTPLKCIHRTQKLKSNQYRSALQRLVSHSGHKNAEKWPFSREARTVPPLTLAVIVDNLERRGKVWRQLNGRLLVMEDVLGRPAECQHGQSCPGSGQVGETLDTPQQWPPCKPSRPYKDHKDHCCDMLESTTGH